MSINRMCIGVFCAATLMSSGIGVAQTGSPGGGGQQPAGQQQSGQQQSGQQPGNQQVPSSTATSGTVDPTVQSMKDKLFLHQAEEGGMAEVQLGQLAAQNGGSAEVKQFGQKMVDDHTMLNSAMKPIADSMGVKEPKKLNKKDQAELDKLHGLSGDAFDKEYLAYMSKDHHNDLKQFKEEDATVGDAKLKGAIDKGIEIIQQHTMMVDQLAKSKGVMVAEKS